MKLMKELINLYQPGVQLGTYFGIEMSSFGIKKMVANNPTSQKL